MLKNSIFHLPLKGGPQGRVNIGRTIGRLKGGRRRDAAANSRGCLRRHTELTPPLQSSIHSKAILVNSKAYSNY